MSQHTSCGTPGKLLQWVSSRLDREWSSVSCANVWRRSAATRSVLPRQYASRSVGSPERHALIFWWRLWLNLVLFHMLSLHAACPDAVDSRKQTDKSVTHTSVLFSSSGDGNVSLLSCAFCSGRIPSVPKIKTRSQFFRGCSSEFSSDQYDGTKKLQQTTANFDFLLSDFLSVWNDDQQLQKHRI